MSDQTRADEAGKRRVLDWIGVRRDEVGPSSDPNLLIARINDLEAEVSQLRSRRDLTDLSAAELESLAAETAVSIIRTVHAREAEAKAAAASILDAALKKSAASAKSAELQVQQATAKSEELVRSAEKAAAAKTAAAEKSASDIVASANREAADILRSAEAAAAKLRQAAEQGAAQVVAEANRAAEQARREADAYAQEITEEADEQVAEVRRALAASVEAAREAHRGFVDAQDRLRASHERSVRGAATALELLEEQASTIAEQLK